MAALPPVVSVAGDIRNEAALEFLPALGRTENELMVACDGVTHADAWSGAALRTLIEYAASWLGMPVTLALPKTAAVRSLLATLVGDLPNGSRLPEGATWPASSRSVLLPGVRIRNSWQAEQYANAFATVAERNYARSEVTFLAAGLGTLLDNVFQHASSSPVGAIACVAHEREENELQLVVSDLAESISREQAAGDALEAAWVASQAGHRGVPRGLAGIAGMAERRGLDTSIALHSGTGRLHWRAGKALKSTGSYVPGFTAVVTVHRG